MLRWLLDYQAWSLADHHFYFCAAWVEGGRRRRQRFETRAEAEAEARRHDGGRVEPVRRAEAYDVLGMPLGISGEPLPDLECIRGCRAHQGIHPVDVALYKVTVPEVGCAIGRAVVATCEGFLENTTLLSEHQAAARAERRAYCRAMKQLLRLGEPAPYVPDRETPTDGAHHPMQVKLQEDPEDVAAAWAALWGRARALGFANRISVHDFFSVSRTKGALRRLAEVSARDAGTSLAEGVWQMREELVALPEEWVLAGPTVAAGVPGGDGYALSKTNRGVAPARLQNRF